MTFLRDRSTALKCKFVFKTDQAITMRLAFQSPAKGDANINGASLVCLVCKGLQG